MATAFDTLLACLLPLAVCLVGYRLRDQIISLADLCDLLFPNSRPPSANSLFGLERAYHAFSQYERLCKVEITRMKASYANLGRAHKSLGSRIGYPQKFDRLWDATSLNGTIASDIAELATTSYPSLKDIPKFDANIPDLARAREALKHFVRDWSAEGEKERKAIFSPILNLLSTVDPNERGSHNVLVPGCGLGRLAWEISQLGFDTSANELSYFMILAFRLLLATKQTDEHKLRPYAHWWSHQRNNDSLFRAVSFPDALPSLGPNFRLIEGDFLKIPPSDQTEPTGEFWKGAHPSSHNGGYHFIITLFFIDTSTNAFATMEHIYRLLRPGGSWVNLGPLLWTGGAQSRLELSLEEVLLAAEEIGFIIQRDHEDDTHPEARRTIECEYTADRAAMMRWTYKAEYWVARKSK